MKTFQEENDQLLNSFLERTFFDSWRRKSPAFGSLELQMGTTCNLKCKYCYYARYGESLYPKRIQNPDTIFNNLKTVLNWLVKNNYFPKIELFSGDPLIQDLGFKCLKLIMDSFKSAKSKVPSIVIPTNYTFLASADQTKKVEKLIKYSERTKVPIFLSASFDGKYCEGNRPFKSGRETRDDKYYDRCFTFNKKWSFGFHPMIYSELIENWEKNFLWFQKNFKKFGIPFHRIYLLEVRNAEWRDWQIKKFMNFIEFLIDWTYHVPCKKNAELFFDFFFKNRGYNILTNSTSTIGRGLGCSIQNTLNIRLGDLKIVPCHRTSYPPFVTGEFVIKNGEVTKIKSRNPEMMIGEITFDGKNLPHCENCLLRHACSKGCLGSQFETTGDLFSPIPTVCKLEHAKVYAIIKTLKRLNLYGKIYEKLTDEKRISFDILDNLLTHGENKYLQA